MSSTAVTLTEIASPDWSVELGSIGSVVQGVDDVDQCIAIILTTPRGSDPLRPTFGANLWSFIDSPISAAIPSIVKEVAAAITMWEPRVVLQSILVKPVTSGDSQAGAHLTVAVTWKLKIAGAASAQTTTINLPGGA